MKVYHGENKNMYASGSENRLSMKKTLQRVHMLRKRAERRVL
jgi:hypothetical protein